MRNMTLANTVASASPRTADPSASVATSTTRASSARKVCNSKECLCNVCCKNMFCGNAAGVEEERRAFLGEDTFDDVRLGLWELRENGCRIVNLFEMMKEIVRRKEMKE